jgi:Tfp pilus assembly protein PilN
MRPVNLLPESQRRRRPEGDGKSSYVVLGILIVLLAMSGLYVVTSNQVTSRNDAAAVASAEADRLEVHAASLSAFGDFAQIKATRVASVRQLAEQRFDWERLMLELARVLPADGWLQTVEASTTAEAEETTAIASTGGPTATLVGCLPRQPDVADLMLRLRRMHRVEDVALSESLVEDERTPPTVDTCGRYYKFDVTVSFAPAVSREAPDGQRRVPAVLGGGS